jgi:methionine-rich copper-binding protein CopC
MQTDRPTINHRKELTMKTLKLFVQSALFAASALLTHAALAHATLQSAAPAQGAQLAAPPKEVMLRFNEKLEGTFSTIQVLDGQGKTVTADKAAVGPADATTLTLALPALQAGQYTVQWVAIGADGHRRKGSYTFSVK